MRNIVTHLKCILTTGESASETDTTKAVKCFNIFNHDSWPEKQDDLFGHGANDLAFLLDHFSTVLRRWITTILCVLLVDIFFMWTLIICVIHIIFRNGVNTELAKEEFVGLKLLIARMFKDKTYLSLWELMLTKEPYCSEYKVSFC